MVQTYPLFEIIFVDNMSSDGSVDYIKKSHPSVIIIENKVNLGFAKANNIGIQKAKGELIITLNNDTEAMPQWIEELVNVALSNEKAGICSSKMMLMSDHNLIDSTGLCISRSGACWDRGQYEIDTGKYESVEEVFGACAGAALYRKKMLDEIGLFDEDFFSYMEDVDIALRARLAGWKCLYAPKAVVYHYRGGTGGKVSDNTVYYGNRNIIWQPVKNFPAGLLILSLPWIIGRNIASVPFYILKGYGKAIIRSKIDAILGLRKMLNKRKRTTVPEKEISRFIHTWASIPHS